MFRSYIVHSFAAFITIGSIRTLFSLQNATKRISSVLCNIRRGSSQRKNWYIHPSSQLSAASLPAGTIVTPVCLRVRLVLPFLSANSHRVCVRVQPRLDVCTTYRLVKLLLPVLRVHLRHPERVTSVGGWILRRGPPGSRLMPDLTTTRSRGRTKLTRNTETSPISSFVSTFAKLPYMLMWPARLPMR